MVGANDGRVYGFAMNRAGKDQPIWVLNSSHTLEPHESRAHAFTRGAIKGSIAMSFTHGLAYAGSWDYYVYAIDTITGSLAWKFNAGSRVMACPALDEHRSLLYIGTVENRFSWYGKNGKLS